jgi:hypothetical protein
VENEGHGVKTREDFLVIRKMVFLAKKIFSFARTLVCEIESILSVMHTIFTMTKTAVTTAGNAVGRADHILSYKLKFRP